MSRIKVIGVAGNPEFVHFKQIANTERKKTYEIQEMFEVIIKANQSEYDNQMKRLKKDNTMRLQLKKMPPLTAHDQFQSFDDSFMTKTLKRPLLIFQNGTPTVHRNRQIKYSQSVINESLKSQLQCFNSRQSDYAFMELQIGELVSCKIVIELYKDFAPKACQNFLKFCEGITIDNVHYCYKNTNFNRFQPNGYIQAGAFGKKISAFGGYFEDESYAIKHDYEGILGFANDGFQHTNTSQFYITLAPFPWFNKKRVGFGKIVQGMKELQKLIKISQFQNNNFKILIKDCGKHDQEKIIRLKLDKFVDDFQCVIPQKAMTINKFIENEQQKHNEASGIFTELIKTLIDLMKQINQFAYHPNARKKAIQLLKEQLQNSKLCSMLYIIDTQEILTMESQNGRYLVSFKIIDGNDSCRGSGFIIQKKMTTIFKQVSPADFRQTGENVNCVCYCTYGRTTQLVLGIGYNLSVFTLADEFYLTQLEMQIPKVETFYSKDIDQQFENELCQQLPTKYQRYTNSVFTTLHRVVRLGGLAIFKEVSIFEAIICSFVLSRSWGWSFCDGTTTFNQIRIKELNQTTYLYIGQQRWIQKIENKYLAII